MVKVSFIIPEPQKATEGISKMERLSSLCLSGK